MSVSGPREDPWGTPLHFCLHELGTPQQINLEISNYILRKSLNPSLDPLLLLDPLYKNPQITEDFMFFFVVVLQFQIAL